MMEENIQLVVHVDDFYHIVTKTIDFSLTLNDRKPIGGPATIYIDGIQQSSGSYELTGTKGTEDSVVLVAKDKYGVVITDGE
jgi:hypothetical protein